MDLFAAELGLDPVEVRRRNLFPPTRSRSRPPRAPATTAATTSARSTSRSRPRTTRRCARSSSAAASPATRGALGIGVSVYVEITNGLVEPELGAVEITPDGGAVLRTGSFSHGQGHETTFAMIVADRLGLPVEAVRVIKGDTDEVVAGRRARTARSRPRSAASPRASGGRGRRRARRACSPPSSSRRAPTTSCSTSSRGGFHVVGSPTPVADLEGARRPPRRRRDGSRSCARPRSSRPTRRRSRSARTSPSSRSTPRPARSSSGASSPSTTPAPSSTRVIAEGQVHGGVAAGVAQALFEEFVYDDDGNPLTASFLGYAFPSAAELPSWDVVGMETPTPLNALGAKGIGESGHDRRHSGSPERRRGRARPVRRPARRDARERRARVARAAAARARRRRDASDRRRAAGTRAFIPDDGTVS